MKMDDKKSSTRRQYLKSSGVIGLASFAGLAGCTGGSGNGTNSSNSNNANSSNSASSAQSSGNVITLGGTLPLTGDNADTGESVQIGYKAAIQKINEMGGIPIGKKKHKLQLSVQDDATNPDRAVSQYQKLISQRNINFLLGSFGSSIVLPTAAICNKNKKPMVQAGGGSDKIFNQGWSYVYGLFPRASRQERNGAALYMNDVSPTPKTVSIISENVSYSKGKVDGWKKEFAKSDTVQTPSVHEISEQSSSFSSVLSKVQSENPDLLILTTHAQNSLQIVKSIKTKNINFNGIDIGLGPHQKGFQNNLGKTANYIFTHTYWSPNLPYKGTIFKNPMKFKQYVVDNFDKATMNSFDYHIATAAAAIITYYHAIKNAGEIDAKTVNQEIDKLSLGPKDTFYGPIEYTKDGDGDAKKLGSVWEQMLKQKLKTVYPENAAVTDYVWPVPDWSKRNS